MSTLSIQYCLTITLRSFSFLTLFLKFIKKQILPILLHGKQVQINYMLVFPGAILGNSFDLRIFFFFVSHNFQFVYQFSLLKNTILIDCKKMCIIEKRNKVSLYITLTDSPFLRQLDNKNIFDKIFL